MTLESLAYWIGYIVIFTGGALGVLMIVGLAAWAVVEWYWRRYGDWKTLRAFFIWRRDQRHPPAN